MSHMQSLNTYISMLRGINLAGKNVIRMEDLRKLYVTIGFRNIQTYVQSGNVIFKSAEANPSKLATKIEKRINQKFSFDVPVLIRTQTELQKIIDNSPFGSKDPTKLYVTFLSDEPTILPVEEIRVAKSKNEEFLISGKEVYLFCPNGYATTKMSNNFFERRLQVRATTRYWKTVNTLSSLAKRK